MMSLGFVSAILPEFSFAQVIETAARLDFDCVEIMCWPVGKADRRYAGITHLDVSDFREENVREIKTLLEQHRIAISGLGYYPNALAPNREEAEAAATHLRRVIEASALLGIHQVNTFLGRDWTVSVEENWPRFLETWGPLVEHAESHGVRIGIENCPMLFSRDEWPGGKNLAGSPKIWRKMFTDIPSHSFGLNYDPSHLVWQQMDYLAPLRAFSDRLFHAHAKDVFLDRAALNEVGILAFPLEYHTPKLPGLGEVDWGKYVSMLREVGYHGPVCVEVEDRTYEGSLEGRLTALKQSCHFLRNFIPKPVQ